MLDPDITRASKDIQISFDLISY